MKLISAAGPLLEHSMSLSGIGSSDLCIHSRSGCHLEMLLNYVSHANHRLFCTEIFALKATGGNKEEIFPIKSKRNLAS